MVAWDGSRRGSSASIRGGFFKALNEYYGKEQSFNLRRPRSAASSQQLDEDYLLSAQLVPTASQSVLGDVDAFESQRTQRREAGPSDARLGGNSSGDDVTDASKPSRFLERLSLGFLVKLWDDIKQNSMLSTAAARGGNSAAHEVIDLADFKRLWRGRWAHEYGVFEPFLDIIFDSVDRRKRGAVQTTDIATAFVLICSEGRIPKLKTLFRIFDADDDSCLTHDEIFDMYVSIKVNDITRNRQALAADVTFDEELSLQEAKRLYELTVEHMSSVSDFVIFEEFSRVFDSRPHLIENLLPGTFSLDWILRTYAAPSIEGDAFGLDVRKGLVAALRRGEEHLNLSKKRGRGRRIMHHCLNLRQAHRHVLEDAGLGGREAYTAGSASTTSPIGASAGQRHGTKNLPKINSARKPSPAAAPSSPTRSRLAPATPTGAGGATMTAQLSLPQATQEVIDEDGDASDDDMMSSYIRGPGTGLEDAHKSTIPPAMRGPFAGPSNASTPRSVAAPAASFGRVLLDGGGSSGYNMHEAAELPALPVLTLNHKNSKRFRSLVVDDKTQQAYLRDQKADVKRSVKYQCLVCSVNHDFSIGKPPAGSAEQQH
mmetsp:Transcript_41918/g.96173  ORF Transcript_41918/g.96173 Transcript_41918/m.96173 type:complete len:599 (+) Transcript_41918:96-1892(+)